MGKSPIQVAAPVTQFWSGLVILAFLFLAHSHSQLTPSHHWQTEDALAACRPTAVASHHAQAYGLPGPATRGKPCQTRRKIPESTLPMFGGWTVWTPMANCRHLLTVPTKPWVVRCPAFSFRHGKKYRFCVVEQRTEHGHAAPPTKKAIKV